MLLELTAKVCTCAIELKRLTTKPEALQDKIKLVDVASKQIYDKDYSFNAHVNGDAQRYGLALVGPECSRQLEHWWYLAGARVITESEVAAAKHGKPTDLRWW